MRVLLKPWFATLVLLLALAVWALTVGPWGRWQEHTVLAQRVTIAGDPYQFHTTLSPPLSMSGAPATLRIDTAPPASAPQGPGFALADVEWAVVDRRLKLVNGTGGDEGFMPPGPLSSTQGLVGENGRTPRGDCRLRLKTTATPGTTISATVIEKLGYVAGVIPVVWPVLLAGIVYIGLTVMRLRRRYPPNPLVVVQGRERY